MIPSSSPRFLPQLEGLRAVAALGVLVTHVAFQTGVDPETAVGAILARFDYFVAVFFGISAFLLWRGYRRDGYFLRRFSRIVPAYLVCVITVLALLPAAFGTSWWVTLSTLSFTQIYFPQALAPGLTHLWSLAVEVAFYLFLPVIAVVVSKLGRKQRIAAFLGLGIMGLCWVAIPWPYTPESINFQIFPFSYLPWFVVGLLCAELEGSVRLPAWTRSAAWPLALGVCWIAGQSWFGPVGLEHPESYEFVLKILAGTLFCALLLAPYALTGPGKHRSLLESKWALAVGTWSYSLFLWHLPLLSWVFPLTGIHVFSGSWHDFWCVLGVLVALSIPISALSYTFIEEPVRLVTKRWLTSRRSSPKEQ